MDWVGDCIGVTDQASLQFGQLVLKYYSVVQVKG
jgi:hypothetical protein